jgi:hypothetical protein
MGRKPRPPLFTEQCQHCHSANTVTVPIKVLSVGKLMCHFSTGLLRFAKEGQPGDYPSPLPPHTDAPRDLGMCQVYSRYVQRAVSCTQQFHIKLTEIKGKMLFWTQTKCTFVNTIQSPASGTAVTTGSVSPLHKTLPSAHTCRAATSQNPALCPHMPFSQ